MNRAPRNALGVRPLASVTAAATVALCAASVGGLGAAASHDVSAEEGPCGARVRHDVLPVWMRGGFSNARLRVPYVLGTRGQLGGVVFGWPLHSPPLPRRANKILWVPRRYPKTVAAFWIKLQLIDGDRAVGAPVRKIIPTGPGPSIVDVPSAGCWRATFAWSGRHDTLDLNYLPPD